MSSIGSASKSYALENRNNQSFHISAEKEDSDTGSISSEEDQNFKDLEVRDMTPEEEKKLDSPDT